MSHIRKKFLGILSCAVNGFGESGIYVKYTVVRYNLQINNWGRDSIKK